jgi:hypothetical protein
MAPAITTDPLFVSVAEAAHILGISRTLAYDLAHLGLATEGAEGLPAIRLGRRLLISRTGLSHLIPGQDNAVG